MYHQSTNPFIHSNVVVSPTHPVIGSVITNEQAYQLCQKYGLVSEAQRLIGQPDRYKSWSFDGVSGLPDHLMNLIGHGYNVTYQCALPHDLAYAYGLPGDSEGRRRADRVFRENLVSKAGVSPIKAYVCWLAVRLLGSHHFGLSFSWAFADKTIPHYTSGPLKISL